MIQEVLFPPTYLPIYLSTLMQLNINPYPQPSTMTLPHPGQRAMGGGYNDDAAANGTGQDRQLKETLLR